MENAMYMMLIEKSKTYNRITKKVGLTKKVEKL